jgi:hypothetical protein
MPEGRADINEVHLKDGGIDAVRAVLETKAAIDEEDPQLLLPFSSLNGPFENIEYLELHGYAQGLVDRPAHDVD